MKLLDDKSRHDELMLQEAGGGYVMDTSIHQNARIQQDRVISLGLALEFDVRDDETEVIARLEDEADAQVAADEADDEVDEEYEDFAVLSRKGLVDEVHVLRVHEPDDKAERVCDQQADEEPEERAGVNLVLFALC